MSEANANVSRLHLASAAFPGKDGWEEFQETVCRQILNVDIEPLDDAFMLDCTLHFIPGFAVGVDEVAALGRTM